jgi:intein/homing endonuclease
MKISEEYPELMTADGFDEAILGVVQRMGESAICYDEDKVIEILMDRDEMTYEEAVEYFDFNIAGAWVGEFTPFFLKKMEL